MAKLFKCPKCKAVARKRFQLVCSGCKSKQRVATTETDKRDAWLEHCRKGENVLRLSIDVPEFWGWTTDRCPRTFERYSLNHNSVVRVLPAPTTIIAASGYAAKPSVFSCGNAMFGGRRLPKYGVVAIELVGREDALDKQELADDLFNTVQARAATEAWLRAKLHTARWRDSIRVRAQWMAYHPWIAFDYETKRGRLTPGNIKALVTIIVKCRCGRSYHDILTWRDNDAYRHREFMPSRANAKNGRIGLCARCTRDASCRASMKDSRCRSELLKTVERMTCMTTRYSTPSTLEKNYGKDRIVRIAGELLAGSTR